MDSFWQSLTLANLSILQWQRASVVHRFVVGLLEPWRRNSFVLRYGDGIGALWVCLILAIAPFVPNVLIGLLIAAAIGFWVLLTLSDKPGQGLTPIHLTVMLFWGISLLATALSPVKVAAAKGLAELSLYLLFFVFMARVLRSPVARKWIIGTYLFTALVVSAYGVRQHFTGVEALATWVDPTSEQSNVTRVFSYLGNPNLFAAYLIPAVTMSLSACFVWRRPGPRALAVFMFLANTACVAWTYSRGGWLGLVLGLFVMALLLLSWWSIYFTPFWHKWALPLVLGGLGGFLVVAVIGIPALRLRVLSMFMGRGDSSNNFRINVWTSAIEMIKDRPILGIGPGHGAFNKIYPQYQKPKFTALSAYSIFLETLVETGVIGFMAFAWLLVVTFNQGWRQLQRLRAEGDVQAYWLMGAIAALPGELGQGLFDTVFYRPEVNTLWWMCVALIASFYVPQPQTLGTETPESIAQAHS